MNKTVTKNKAYKAYSAIKGQFKVSECDTYSSLEALPRKTLIELLREREINIPKIKYDMISLLGMWIETNCKIVKFEII